ncbi:hypothetical protein VTI74DRAFT_5233 [Chaetomium olivicolor]
MAEIQFIGINQLLRTRYSLEVGADGEASFVPLSDGMLSNVKTKWIEITGCVGYPTSLDAHHRLVSHGQGGSCSGFIQSTRVQRWRAGQSRILFCYGVPGCGKSTAVSRLVELIMFRPRMPGKERNMKFEPLACLYDTHQYPAQDYKTGYQRCAELLAQVAFADHMHRRQRIAVHGQDPFLSGARVFVRCAEAFDSLERCLSRASLAHIILDGVRPNCRGCDPGLARLLETLSRIEGLSLLITARSEEMSRLKCLLNLTVKADSCLRNSALEMMAMYPDRRDISICLQQTLRPWLTPLAQVLFRREDREEIEEEIIALSANCFLVVYLYSSYFTIAKASPNRIRKVLSRTRANWPKDDRPKTAEVALSMAVGTIL